MKYLFPIQLPLLAAAVGDAARQMAAAPPAEKPAPPAKVDAAKNRFHAMFPFKPQFVAAGNTQTYGEDRKSRTIAHVVLDIANPLKPGQPSGAVVQAVIKAVQNKGQAKAKPEFAFIGSMQKGQAIKANDPAAQIELDAFKKSIAVLYLKYREDSGIAAQDEDTSDVGDLDIELK